MFPFDRFLFRKSSFVKLLLSETSAKGVKSLVPLSRHSHTHHRSCHQSSKRDFPEGVGLTRPCPLNSLKKKKKKKSKQVPSKRVVRSILSGGCRALYTLPPKPHPPTLPPHSSSTQQPRGIFFKHRSWVKAYPCSVEKTLRCASNPKRSKDSESPTFIIRVDVKISNSTILSTKTSHSMRVSVSICSANTHADLYT